MSAHAAIDKACDLMGIRLVKVAMTSDYQIDVSAVRRALSADTIMVYSSAPSFPQVPTNLLYLFFLYGSLTV